MSDVLSINGHMHLLYRGTLLFFFFFFKSLRPEGENKQWKEMKAIAFVMCPQRSIWLFLCVDESIMSPGSFMHNIRPTERTGNATLFWTSVRTKCQAIRREHSCICFCCLTNSMSHKIQTSFLETCLKMFIYIIMIVVLTVWNIEENYFNCLL